MKDYKKHIRLFLSLLCLVICGALLLSACGESGKKDPSTEPPTVSDTTEGTTEVTVGDTTEPATEATTEETEPETTQEPTEAPTRPTSSGGTGGGYTPQTSEPAQQPTEPEEDATQPEIQVPAAGSETNAYYENITALPDTFTTVKIPAQTAMHYIVKSAGALLRIESADAAVIYDGKTCAPIEGVLEVQLPGSESANALLQIVNNGAQEQSFTVQIIAALGAQSNPVVLTEISQVSTKLEKDDADGLFYSWTADKSGILSLGLSSINPANAGADVIVTVNGKTVKLSESQNGLIQLPVEAGEQVLVQVIAKADGENSYPAVEAVVNGSIAPVAELKAESIPQQLSTDEIAPGETAYYNVYGVNGTVLVIRDAAVTVICDGAVYAADANDVITMPIAPGPEDQAVQLEILNGGDTAKAVALEFNYPAGHEQNPQILTELGEVETAVQAGTDGYFYQYTAAASGAVTFRVAKQPNVLGVRTDIIVVNQQTQQEERLWTENADGNLVQQEAVVMDVTEGDVLSVCVRVVDMVTENCVDAKLTVLGKLDAFQMIEYPGFTAKAAAGETAYYEGYGLDDTIFCLTGENVAVTYGEVTYIPKDGQIQFRVTEEGRMPARFKIENRGEADAEYEVTFRYSVGHRMNPDTMALGSSFINQAAGADEYCFNYAAPKAGQLILTFDAEASWCYTVDNLTQQIYGETCFSDGETAADTAVIDVAEGDEIQLRVNTYDPEAPWAAPEGSVEFEATLLTGPVEMADLSKPFVSTLLAGETVEYTGALQGMLITIENAQNATLCYQGEYYEANESGVLALNFLEPNGTENTFSFTIHNRAAEPWKCTMSSTPVAGGPLAPGELKLGVNEVNTPENSAGYWFCYTAPKAGDLVLTFDEEAAWSYAIDGGENRHSDTAEAQVKVAVAAEDTVLIWVNTYDPAAPETTPAGTVSFEATLITGPVQIADITVPFETVLLAGETVTYTGKLHGATVSIADAQNATLCYDGKYYEANEEGILTVAFLEPNTVGELEFTLHNRATEDWNCTMTVTAITGGPLEPGAMQLGNGSVSCGENSTGYWFGYTTSKQGQLILTFDEEADWQCAVNGGEILSSGSENASNVAQIPVQSGEQILIWVNTYDPEDPENTPEGTITFHAELQSIIELTDLEKAHTELLQMSETALFTGDLRNTIVTISNADYLSVHYNGQDYTADANGMIVLTCLEPDSDGLWQFSVKNISSSEQSCPIRFGGLKGHWLNPERMVLDNNTVQLEEGAAEYCFSYTAPKAGELMVMFDPNAHCSYRVNDGETVYIGGENVDSIAHVMLKAGEKALIFVNTYDPENPETTPAGTVTFQACFLSDPVEITDLMQPYAAQILMGETSQYTGYFKDAIITVTDAQYLYVSYAGENYTPNEEGIITFAFNDEDWTFIVANSTNSDVSYTMTFSGEAGTWLNPDAMVLGTTTVEQTAGADDYYLSCQIPKTGELTLTFDAAANWCYVLGDGEKQYSTTPGADVVKLAVEAGDVLQLQVNTYDPEAPETAPEGAVTFTAVLYTGSVSIENPAQPTMLDMVPGEIVTVTVPGSACGEQLGIANAANLTLTLGDTVYTADSGGILSVTLPEEIDGETMEFTLYNSAAENKSYTLVFGGEKGTATSPAELVVGSNTAVCQEGSDGYYFTFTATRRCVIRLAFEQGTNWAYEYRYSDESRNTGNNSGSASGLKFRSGVIEVGETITVVIKTYDPENPDVVPEGFVQFAMDIPAYY